MFEKKYFILSGWHWPLIAFARHSAFKPKRKVIKCEKQKRKNLTRSSGSLKFQADSSGFQKVAFSQLSHPIQKSSFRSTIDINLKIYIFVMNFKFDKSFEWGANYL